LVVMMTPMATIIIKLNYLLMSDVLTEVKEEVETKD
jgi:hypothetical protein